MCQKNFRIRIDLCKFYDDARRLCWIFIDGTKILKIAQLKEHIIKLFNVKEPFHLLLNQNEYLPVEEDIRILKENETILVSPGSGFEHDLDLNISTTSLQNQNREEAKNDYVILEGSFERNAVQQSDKQLQTNISFMLMGCAQETPLTDTVNKPQHDCSEISTISQEVEEQSEASSTIGTRSVDKNLTEDDVAIVNQLECPKRKRTRTRKKKAKEAAQQQQAIKEAENKSKKPKIINSCIITSGKHIRFDNLDIEQLEQQIIHPEITVNGATESITEVPASHELATLLSLGKNGTPVTFTNTRIKTEVKIEDDESRDAPSNASLENQNEHTPLVKNVEEREELSNKDFLTCPIMNAKPNLKDVIAFKMLKIGADYTPQVSEFIIAEVIACCPKTSMYTFKVIKGLSEVQVPVGKFTITDKEEEQVLSDTITLNIAQMMEPRLIATCDVDKPETPFDSI